MALLWIEFVNSLARDPLGRGRDVDHLEEPAWCRAFEEKWSLDPIDLSKPAPRRAMADLRALLTKCTNRLVDGKPLTAEQVRSINRHLGSQPIVSRLRRDGGRISLENVPAVGGIDNVLATIARSFAEFLCTEEPSRLKTCRNPDCCWVFYDTTRSRTRRWCADSCGNLMKVRRFRQRRPNRG